MSRQVMADTKTRPAPLGGGGVLQRSCACGQHAGPECEDCRRKRTLQRYSTSRKPGGVPALVREVLDSPGQSLDAGTRAFMEPRLGGDFSRVRVHNDRKAAESAHTVNALGYTVGQDVVFGAGQYAPNTAPGRRLMAHELVHVVQQDSARSVAHDELTIGNPSDSSEREAEDLAEQVTRDVAPAGEVRIGVSGPPTLQRSCADGKCDDCGGGTRDFWITAFFRRPATSATIAYLRGQINDAKTILANCCLNLKVDFNWSLLRGSSTFPVPTSRPAGDALGSRDYSADAEALGEGPTFAAARGVPMLVVDDVPQSGGGVTVLRGVDAEYTGLNYFAIAVNQPRPNTRCNHIAHELWHMTGAARHNAAEGPITACLSNAVSLKYCNALRAMVAPVGDFPLPAEGSDATRMV